MVRMHRWIGLAAVGLSLTGCVSQEKYNALKLERDRLSEQLVAAQSQFNSAKAELDAYKRQIGGIGDSISNQTGLINNLQAQNAELQRRYEDAMSRLQEALARTGQSALPEALNNELQAFADANPDLVTFDRDLGVVKFKSDVTFAVGDASLTPKAREVIQRFSQILNSGATAQYELMVAGHTDNTRVSNPATKAKGHHDNWYLSAHRAISVADELIKQRVAPNRVAVVGYADQRPVAPNTTEAGRAANRRVEVLILPTTVRSAPVQPAGPAGAPAADPLNKDAIAPAQPGLNK